MSALRADQIASFLAGAGRPALAAYLSRQRWFAAKARGVSEVSVEDWAELQPSPPIALLLLRADGERYYAPVAASSTQPDSAQHMVARIEGQAVFDAHWDPDFGRRLLSAIATERTLQGAIGRFACRAVQPWSGPTGSEAHAGRPLGGEQSNTSLLFGSALVLKSFRRPQAGVNPDVEITRFLTIHGRSADVPPLVGWIDYAGRDGDTATVAVLQGFVDNRGDGWEYALAGLRRLAEAEEGESGTTTALADELAQPLRALGAVTGRLHAALASDSAVPEFRPEPITDADAATWTSHIARAVDKARAELVGARAASPGAASVLAALDRRGAVAQPISRALRALVDGRVCKIRCHGDYHLGQVLKTPSAFAVIDFEGEPSRPLADRRRKQTALRDVAGMLRSFDYAIHAVGRERAALDRSPRLDRLSRWRDAARRAFLGGYAKTVSQSPVALVPDGAAALAHGCAAFELEKACYELSYEIDYRPDWIEIPLAGIARILDVGLPRD
jgi:trehalose synthase-fused probable maltokinase